MLYYIEIITDKEETCFFNGFALDGEIIHSGSLKYPFTRTQARRIKKMLLSFNWIEDVKLIETDNDSMDVDFVHGAVNAWNQDIVEQLKEKLCI